METQNKSTFISKECAKRLMQDIKQLIKNPLDEHGIYYSHDEENILRGYALIVGGEDTPYFGGYYFFVFNYTNKYPFEPPVVDYCTNDGKTRFNPNLYVNKKTCLSILNTWKGEQWSACQTISSVLLSLSTILCKNPLLNEPHVTITHKDFHTYTQSIEFANIDIACCEIVLENPNICFSFFALFREQIHKHFRKNIDKLIEFCENQRKGVTVLSVGLYYMNTKINYKLLLEKLNRCKIKIESI
jgi:ubiquitin-protein ligase